MPTWKDKGQRQPSAGICNPLVDGKLPSVSRSSTLFAAEGHIDGKQHRRPGQTLLESLLQPITTMQMLPQPCCLGGPLQSTGAVLSKPFLHSPVLTLVLASA